MSIKTTRSIRVFVSSTFIDMQHERDELAKFIFPQLRLLCSKRNVAWKEVDLRWGITESEIKEGKLLPVIIDEIERSHPHFIGILGDRYGYIPKSVPKELLEREPWLKQHLKKSITEMEIIHGVLDNPEHVADVFFYFRSPSFYDNLSEAEKLIFTDRPSAKDYKIYGKKTKLIFKTRQKKLNDLKNRIQGSIFPFKEFQDAKHLGELILDDFTKLIDKKYPLKEIQDTLFYQTEEHQNYLLERTRIYIGGIKYIRKINNFLEDNSQKILVTGEAGIGKTSLMASIIENKISKLENSFLFFHFVGANNLSTTWENVLTRFIYEYGIFVKQKIEMPSNPEELKSTFLKLFYSVPNGLKIFIIIDAINQLDEKSEEIILSLFTNKLPKNIFIILSSLCDRHYLNLIENKYSIVEVKKLSYIDKKRLIVKFYKQFGKKLNSNVSQLMVDSEKTAHPLFLKIILEELRVYGYYDKLEEMTIKYLKAESIDDLYQLILDRYEKDYNTNFPNLVEICLKYIVSSRKGLYESEIIDLVSLTGKFLIPSIWSPLFIALSPSVVNDNGRISIYHDFFKNAINKRYLNNAKEVSSIHNGIAKYFLNRETDYRRIEELPWQLIKARKWSILEKVLIDPIFFNQSWKFNKFDIKSSWKSLESAGKYKMIDSYLPLTKSPSKYPFNYEYLTQLFFESGKWKETLQVADRVLPYFRKTNDRQNLFNTTSYVCNTLLGGDSKALKKAERLLKEQEVPCRENKEYRNLADVFVGLAYFYTSIGNNEKAIDLLKKAIKLSRKVNYQTTLAVCYNNYAAILQDRNEINKAISNYEKCKKLSLLSGEPDNYELANGNLASIYINRGYLTKALDLLIKNEEAYRNWDDRDGMGCALSCQAFIFYEMNQLEKADANLEEYENICRDIENYEWLPIVLSHRGFIKMRTKSFKEGRELVKKALNMFYKRDYFEYVPDELCELGHLLILQHQAKEAFRVINDGLKIAGQKKLLNSKNSLLVEKLLLYIYTNKTKSAQLGLKKINDNNIKITTFKDHLKLLFIKGCCLLKTDKKKGESLIKKALNLSESHKYYLLNNDLIEIYNKLSVGK